jgi:predicted DCC family thiol-disulfide oxidoreductase YuxK
VLAIKYSFVTNHPVVLFDGVCNLCNRSVQLLIRLDRKKVFRFASLQSAFAKKQLSLYDEPKNLPDSIVLILEDKTFFRSDAILRIAWILGGLWRISVLGYLLPGGLRDYLYDRIAANRYRWFGKRGQCMVPDPELKSRFLD